MSVSTRFLRRRAILPVAAAVAVIAAVVSVALPHHHSPQRAAVSRYIEQVNAVQQQMTYPLTKVAIAYRAFTTSHSLSPATARGLAQAERTLAAVDARIARLDTPPQARRLRALILKLVRQETAITHEVDGIVHFAPAFQVAVGNLKGAGTVLTHRLAAIKGPKPYPVRGTPAKIKQAQAAFTAASNASAAAQADAVTAYDAMLGRIIMQLRRLSPPPVFAPAYRAQLSALNGTVAAGARLAAELRKPVRTQVPELSRAFTIATLRTETTAAQRAEIAAVKAYNSRVKAVGATADAVRAELTRLQQHLP
ncbi:MAG: hypothetical protein ACRDNM_12720 [Gaiellaceae bacterium]